MKFRFDAAAERWLEGKGFTQEEKEELLGLLDRFEETMKKRETELIIMPKGTSGKVSAFFDLLYFITDEKGIPTCFEESTICIPEEAKRSYKEGMELHELEEEVERIKNIKMARGRMDPRRRGSKYG